MNRNLTRTPLLYLITGRKQLAPSKGQSETAGLIDFIERAADAGVDLIQIREKDLSARELYYLVEATRERLKNSGCKLLVNDRVDIAASFPDVGVHLTSTSMAASVVRRAFGAEIMIGASTHSPEEVRSAVEGGANFVVFGPVFETVSKKEYGPPQGPDALQTAVNASRRIPVLGLGGISMTNYQTVLETGAAGVAGISLFTGAEDLVGLVSKLKGTA